jgi:hypothetical protein
LRGKHQIKLSCWPLLPPRPRVVDSWCLVASKHWSTSELLTQQSIVGGRIQYSGSKTVNICMQQHSFDTTI